MKIAYNPSGASPLSGAPENNNDIIFDLAGKAIYVKDVKLLGTDTVYDVFKKPTSSNEGGNVGLVPVPSYTDTNTRFLREDGTWVVPTNTTYEVFTGSTLENSGKAGLVPAPSIGFQRLLLSDGTWTLKFLFYDIPASSAIKIAFYSQTHATLFMRHTWSNNMGVYHISGYGSYGDSKRISIVEVTNSCSGIIYPVDGEFAVIIKNPETTHSLFVSATLLLGSISKIETVTSEVTKSDIWRNVLHSNNTFIKNGTININGVSITPLTRHLSLGNYVTLNTDQEITGAKTFTKQLKFTVAEGTAPFLVTSTTTVANLTSNYSEILKRIGGNVNLDANIISPGLGMSFYGGYSYKNASNLPEIDLVSSWQTALINFGILDSINAQLFIGAYDNYLYYRRNQELPWRQIAYTNSDITGNAATATHASTADKLKTKRKLWGLDFDGTVDVSGSLTGVTSINMAGDIIINDGTNKDRYIKWLYKNLDKYGWRIGYLGSAQGNDNDLTFDSHRNEEGWASALYFKHNTLNAYFAGIVNAPTFQGNLDGKYINALTRYSKATSAADLATTDTLNAALGKLEYKAATTYSWYKSITNDDTDDIINKWGEIVGFLDSVKEGTDILDEFVTRKTDLIITGKKTFYGDGSTLLTVKRNHESHPTYIHFADENESLGFIGISKDHKPVFHHEQQYTILHAGNSYIKNGVITINGTSITPLTLHLSLTNYVTLNTYLTITGLKLFNTSTNTLPLLIARGGNNESEVLKIGIDDHNATFEYVNDETSNSFLFKLVNTDIENGGEGINANSSLVKFYGDADGSVVIANKFIGNLNKTLTFAAGVFTAKTYNNSTAVTVNIPTHTSHLTNNSGFLTLHQSLANYVTLDTGQTITGNKTFARIIHGNAYNYNENKAGAYLVLNKGGNYLGIGASSSNIQAIVIGESDLSGTWIKEHVTINTSGHVKATKFIGVSKSGDWYSGRDRATFKTTGYSGGYSPTLSIKTTNGSWELGTYDASSFIDNLIFSYVTDSDYNSDTNESIQIKLPYTKSGTIALTSDITKAAVGLGNVLNTAFYARTATVNGGIWEIAGTKSGATFSIYSPITGGTSGLILVSNGSNAPVWKTATLLTVGTALKLLSGGGNNLGQTSLIYYKFASYTSEDITLQINLNAFFYVTQYYNSHNFGLLRAEVRFNNNETSPVTGKFRIEWLVNSGIDPNSVQMSYLVSGNTRTINIYHKLTTNNWDSFKVIKLSDGAWSAESGTDWELHRDVKLTSLPTDEIFTKSVNVAIANTAAPVEYGLLNLCIGVTAGGLTSVTNNVLTTSGVNSDTYFRLILSEPLEVDQYYTLGFYVENVPLSATSWSFIVGKQSNTNWIINITSNGWVWATGYYNGNGNSLELLIDDSSRNFYDSIKISKIVLVKGKLKAYYSPAPINLNNYTSYLGYIGTTAVQKKSKDQALTGISSATISGVTRTNTLTISSTSVTGHINFSRGSYNYITMPNGGLLHILPDGVGVSSSNGMAFSSKGLHPATNSAYSLGTSSLRWNNVYSVLGNYSGNLTLQTSSGDSPHLVFLRKALTDDNVDWDMYVTGGIFKLRCNPGTDGVESWKEVLSLNSTNSITTAYGITASTFVKSGSSDSYILLGGGSHKAVSDFLLKSELENLALNSNLYKKDISLKPTTLWADVGDLGTLFANPHPGTYAILVYCPQHKEGTINRYHVYYSGIMSITDNTNTTNTSDEIWLHASAHASHIRIYLRTITLTGANYPKLLIAASANFDEAVTFNFKIKRLI